MPLLLIWPCHAAPAVRVIPPPAGKTFTIRVHSRDSIQPAEYRVARASTPGGYAVVASQATYGDPEWRQIVQGLAIRHSADILLYPDAVASVRGELARRLPRYTCFVARPAEAGRQFVVSVHRLTRQLNADPYTDTIWGIVTGYSPADAARIVAQTAPLIIRRGAGGTSIPLDQFDAGVYYDEGKKNHAVEKTAGGRPQDIVAPDDTTKSLVDVFNDYKPDIFMTSGHATERDWQIGYSYRNGQFRCKDGVLLGLDMQRKAYPIHSPNPKVYMAIGNCLMGHVIDDQAMALAWMGSAGVDQMVGYTVETWYGYGGWGINNYFFDQPGRFNLAESVFLANQALQWQLQKRFPETNKVVFNAYGPSGEALPALAGALSVRSMAGDDKDKLGLVWDRDVVAFYGDPAWDARLVTRPQPWRQSLTVKGNRYTVLLKSLAGATCGRPPAIALPKRIAGLTVREGAALEPVIAGRFIMLPGLTRMDAGKEYRVVFDATESGKAVKTQKASTATREESSSAVSAALGKAGSNKPELLGALRDAGEGEEWKAVAFVIANMPPGDAKSLKKPYILENARLAIEARESVAWGKAIPEDVFLNNVLPYANVTETRENWRADFRRRFSDLVKDCKTPSEAALLLNKTIFKALDVQYHATKRPKPDQSPSESIAAKYASCTGLCVLLADACRAVGVPARLVGTPSWVLPGETHPTAGGNHTWVEIWDNGWHFLGAAEESKLDDTWFVDSAKHADPKDPLHRIYAVSFKKTGTSFPMVWAPNVKDVYAEDVTERYKHLGR
ncbi:MAG TPA: transglutaminase-like domain-containing protein [Armatimonadota bacterium]|jgi:zinc protease